MVAFCKCKIKLYQLYIIFQLLEKLAPCKTVLKKDKIKITYQKGTETKSKPSEEKVSTPSEVPEKKEEQKPESATEINHNLRLARLDQLEVLNILFFIKRAI